MLLSETVLSMDKGMKMWFRAIWMRQSGRAPGSGSSEKVATSAMKTLLRDKGVGADNEAELGLGRGLPLGVGTTPVCALEIRVDHSAGVRKGGAGRPAGLMGSVAACGRVGICTLLSCPWLSGASAGWE